MSRTLPGHPELTSPNRSATLKFWAISHRIAARQRVRATGYFEGNMKRIYFDNNATTPLAPEVFEVMRPYMLEDYGNASSIHWFGQRAKAGVEKAREQVARLLNARSSEIVFTSGGTESDNAAILGIVEAARGERKHVVTTAIEHPAVLSTAKALEKRGVSVTYVRVGPSGVIDPADVAGALRPETVLISVMHANNELGTIQPLEEIGRIARERDIYFHTDAVQSVGKIPVDVEKLGVDLLALSAHKLNGPKGVGALYVRKGTILRPLLHGGHHERDRRPGTENVAGIVGLGAAAEIARAHLAEEHDRVAALRDRLEAGILASVPFVAVNGDRAHRVPTTTNLTFDYHRGRRVCDCHGPARHRLLDGLGVLVGVARTLARALGHRAQARAGARQHPLQPGPLQYGRGCRRRAPNPARSGGTTARGVAALPEVQ